MRLLGSFLWLTLGIGFLSSLLYFLLGIALCFTIIGIPFGIQCFKLSELSLMPFYHESSHKPLPISPTSILFNILWVIFIGIEFAIFHVVLAVLFGITLVGIPFMTQHLKLAWLSFLPFGQTVTELAEN